MNDRRTRRNRREQSDGGTTVDGKSDRLTAICCRGGLLAADEKEVGWDGAALEDFGGVPGGAVGVMDGDEVNSAEGAYVMHPDVGVAQTVAAGFAGEFKGFGDVIRWHVGGKDACFGRDAVDGDLDALDGRLGEVVEHEVQTLCGTGLSGIAGGHGVSGSLGLAKKPMGHPELSARLA